MNEVIKLKLNKTTANSEKSHQVIETFIKCCLQLDPSIFEPLIDEDELFQDLDKYRFLNSLKQLFNLKKKFYQEEVTMQHGGCEHCVKGYKTHDFYIGGKFAFSYIIYLENDELVDIFRCNRSSSDTSGKKLAKLFSDAIAGKVKRK